MIATIRRPISAAPYSPGYWDVSYSSTVLWVVYLVRRGAGGWAELIYVTTGCQFITSMNLEIRGQHRCLTRVEFALRFETMIQDWISAFSPDRSVLCFRSSTLLVRYTNRPFRHQGKHTKRLTVQLCVVDHCLHNDRRSASSRRLGIYQSCPWVHFVWPNPTQLMGQPNPWTTLEYIVVEAYLWPARNWNVLCGAVRHPQSSSFRYPGF